CATSCSNSASGGPTDPTAQAARPTSWCFPSAPSHRTGRSAPTPSELPEACTAEGTTERGSAGGEQAPSPPQEGRHRIGRPVGYPGTQAPGAHLGCLRNRWLSEALGSTESEMPSLAHKPSNGSTPFHQQRGIAH